MSVPASKLLQLAHNNHMEQPNHERQMHNTVVFKLLPPFQREKGLPFKERFRNTPVCVMCLARQKHKMHDNVVHMTHDALFLF